MVAFVGSGGAVKGLAHLGVLRAIEEMALEPEIFVGSSSGAIAGACFAQGVKVDEMIDWFRLPWARKEKSSINPFHFLGLPSLDQLRSPGWLGSGLFSIDWLESALAKRLPTNDFRALEKTVLVTATDIDGRGRVVFGRNHIEDVSMSKAVAASSCMPGLFRPYRIGDRYFVDGELVRTLSIDLAVDAGADVVVISNVYRPHAVRAGEKSLAHRGFNAIMRQSANIVLSEKEKRGIDLIHRLHPHVTILNVSADLGDFSFVDLRNARALMTRGYREALKVLANAKDRGVFESSGGVRVSGGTA